MTIDMSNNVDKPKSATAPSNPISVPAQKPLTHIAQALRESIDAALTAEHLLVSAHGGLPPKCDTIKDFPMQSLPPLSTSSPKFDQQFERRLELQRKNDENAAKRLQITVQERTVIYGKVLAWCSDAIELRRRMMTLCKNHLTTDGFDGPRAYKMLMEHLDGNVEDRSKHDSKLYTTAFEMQQKSELPNGCSATQFTTKAYAWIVHILPNLPTEFKDPFAPSEHIISLLPAELRSDGRDLERDLRKTGEWKTTRREDGLMHVMRRCSKLVEKVQKSEVPTKSVFVCAMPPIEHNLAQLAAVAGMPDLESTMTMVGAPADGAGTSGTSSFSFAAAAAGQVKFCKNCPHKEGVQCWRDPNFSGTLPPSVWLNETLRKEIITEKKEMAKKLGVPCKNVSAPPKSKIEAWKQTKAEREKKKKEKEEKDKGGSPAGAFIDGLIDIDDERFGESVHMVGIPVPPQEGGGADAKLDDGMPELIVDDDDASDDGESDEQDDHANEDDLYDWHVAFVDELMFVTVLATVKEGDLEAALDDLPEHGKNAKTIAFGRDKVAAYKRVDEIRLRYFPAPTRPMGFGRGKPMGLALAETAMQTPAGGVQAAASIESDVVVMKQRALPDVACATPLPDGVAWPKQAYSPLNDDTIREMQGTPATASNGLPDTVLPKRTDYMGPPSTPVPSTLLPQTQTTDDTAKLYEQLGIVAGPAQLDGKDELYKRLNIVTEADESLPAAASMNAKRRASASAAAARATKAAAGAEHAEMLRATRESVLRDPAEVERAELLAGQPAKVHSNPIDLTTTAAQKLLKRGWAVGKTAGGHEFWTNVPTEFARPTAGGGDSSSGTPSKPSPPPPAPANNPCLSTRNPCLSTRNPCLSTRKNQQHRRRRSPRRRHRPTNGSCPTRTRCPTRPAPTRSRSQRGRSASGTRLTATRQPCFRRRTRARRAPSTTRRNCPSSTRCTSVSTA